MPAVNDARDTVFCRAELNYAGVEANSVLPVQVVIHDGRRTALAPWTQCGFQLLNHASAVAAWDDDAVIERAHYPEMEALARSLTGCDHAIVSGHIKRNPQQAALHADLGPIAYVHSDFAASYGDLLRDTYRVPRPESQRALQRAGIDGEVVARARRLLVLQFWRNVGPATMDLPLAFCDARSVAPADLQVLPVANYAGGGFDFDTLGISPPREPGRHRWYVFPDMLPDEVVAFRTFDSDRIESGEPFWTPHCAFHDPEVPLGRPSRSSIELRAMCLFA